MHRKTRQTFLRCVYDRINWEVSYAIRRFWIIGKRYGQNDPLYLVKDGTLFLLFGKKDFEKMTSRKYNYVNGLNGHFELALYVDTFEEVDASFKAAVENGAEPVMEPTTEPWGQRTCYIADPEGNLIEIGSWDKPYEIKDHDDKL